MAGVSDRDIAEDYSLTRVGREPAREKVMARLTKEPLFASNNEAALNMFTSRFVPFNSTHDYFYLKIRLHLRRETMLAFLNVIEQKYGGVTEYLKKYIHLSEEDIHTIRCNITLPRTPP